MRVLFLLDSLELGGAERQALLLAEKLRECSHDVVIWGFGRPGAVSSFCEEKGIPCFPREHVHTFRGARKLAVLYRLARDIKAVKPDVLLPYCTYPSTFCSLVWRFTGAKGCIWNQRDAGLYEGWHKAYPFAVNLASAVIANSEAGAVFLQKQRCIRAVEVIHNGVALPAAKKSRPEWRNLLGVEEDTPVCCMVANLSSFKNHGLLLKAWRYGLDAGLIPQNAVLALAGREDEMTSALKESAEALHIARHLKFLGQVDDISGLLGAADIGILSSRSEGLPNAILEYMHAGLPVVASKIPGIREALGEGNQNALFDPESEQDLAQALGSMLHDKDRRGAASQSNRELSRSRFSVDAMVARYEKVIQTCSATPRRISVSVWKQIVLFYGNSIRRRLKRKCKAFFANLFGNRSLKVERVLEHLHFYSPFAFKLAKTVPAKPKIGFAVLAHDRPEYLKICLDSLFSSDIEGYDVTFLIHDDGSTNPDVRSIIEKTRDPKYKIIRVFKQKGHNSWGAAFNSAMRELRRIGNFDIMGSCDSDALFHPQWLRKTLPIFIWAKRYHKCNILGPFSPFNSSDAGFHKILGTYESPAGKYVVKERMGALAYLFFREDFEKIGLFAEDKDDETLKTYEFKKLKIRNISSWESYVEHIGQNSILNLWRPTPVARAVYGLNLARSGWPESFEQVGTLGYFQSVASCSGMSPAKDSLYSLDIIIPATDKDSAVLPVTIQGLQRNLAHPIKNIFVVAPKSDGLQKLTIASGGFFVDERDVAPLAKEEINYNVDGDDRSGWLLQQFIKLNGDKISNNKYFLVIDADTVLVRRQIFEENGRIILLVADEFHLPYYRIFNKLTGQVPGCSISFVSHMMCFETVRLCELRSSIEEYSGRTWWKAILKHLDKNNPSGFSEYELYGHWMLNNHNLSIKREYFKNKSLSRNFLRDNAALEARYGENLRSVSFHSYLAAAAPKASRPITLT